MATIFYSMAGEGRGHATRARTVIEFLRKRHTVFVYAPAQAYALLEPLYRFSDVSVKRIPGLFWQYDSNRRLNYVTSATRALSYISRIPLLVKRLKKDIEMESPDLIISDFDPAMPRAANSSGVPFISFDHQHFILAYDLGSLPEKLKLKAAFMSPAVRLFYKGQVETIVSSFYFPPLKPGFEKVRQIGVLLNEEVLHASRIDGKHLVVYMRKFSSPKLIGALKDCGCDVRIYGLGKRPSEGRLRFHDVNLHRFIEDLALSRGLVCTAGNQVVGEALYLRKPVLAIPEDGNFEQEINGHFVGHSGAGISARLEAVDINCIRGFLDNGDFYRSNIRPEKLNGNTDAFRIIESRLSESPGQGETCKRIPGDERAVS